MHRLLARFYTPKIDWLQVEVSSLCNSSCCYCPQSLEGVEGTLMTQQTFARLLPVFKKTKMVYLQGWGEPFLHPHLFDFIRQAKKIGTKVGTTSNGTILDDGDLQGLVDLELDVLGLSLAGQNDTSRKGTSLGKILHIIKMLQEIRGAGKKPAIHIAYMLLRSQIADLDTLYQSLHELAVDEIVLTTLPYAISPQMEREMICNLEDEEQRSVEKAVFACSESFKKRGIPFYYYWKDENKEHGCTERIESNAFVSAAGNVSPCVFHGAPHSAHSRNPRALCFGNINEESFATIWRKKEYREFRTMHQSGKQHPVCEGCWKRQEVLRGACLPTIDPATLFQALEPGRYF
jgi:radical SAM protein with 4Fe4S-binding SPASM domain